MKKNHYTAIKNLSRLLSKENGKQKGSQHFCRNCLNGFHSADSCDNHYEFCKDSESVKIVMPEEGSKLSFIEGQNQFKAPFMMYADFESVLRPIEHDVKEDNDSKSYTEKINEHIPSGYCVYSKFAYSEVENSLKICRG